MSLFDVGERTVLDLVFGAGAIAGYTPASYQLGLSTTPISDDGTGITEPSGGGYGRLTVTNNATTFPAASTDGGGVTTKTNGVSFTWTPAATGSWGTVAYWFLYDATNARYVVHGDLASPKAVEAGDIFRIPSGGMLITAN